MTSNDSMFPTLFACIIAQEVGLVSEQGKPGENPDYHDEIKKLKEYQNMIIGGVGHEDAKIAYYGIELKEEQETALKLIAKSTKPFVLGELASSLLNKVKKGDGRTVTEAAEILLTEMIGDKATGVTDKRARQLIVQLKR